MASFDKLKKSEAKCISKKGKEAAFFVPQSAGRAEAVIKMELTDAQAKKVSVDKIYPFENGQVQI